MNTQPFLRPKFSGKRFSSHALPLELLKDLSVLEEMIIEAAKWRYFKENPERQRIPRKFADRIELVLTGLEKGSAVPVINIKDNTNTLFPVGYPVYFAQARDSIINAIKAAENNQSITEHLPEKVLCFFDRFGRSLKDGEAIEFSTSTKSSPVKLTKITRRKLIASSNAKEYTEETTARGSIPEADQDKMTFELLMMDGKKIKAPLSAQHGEIILTAFNEYKKGSRVMIEGIGKFAQNNRLFAFESIEHITLLDPLDVPARLDEFRNLNDGWLEGKGTVPKPEKLDWFAETFEQNYPDDLPLPYIYPTAEGNIMAEWSIGQNEISLDINLDTHESEWHRLQIDTDETDTKKLDLDNVGEWKHLIDTLHDLVGVKA